MEEILRLLPQKISDSIKNQCSLLDKPLEEIRLRLNSAVELVFLNKVIWLKDSMFLEQDSTYFIKQLTEHSLYRMQTELKEGFITTRKGHRVGLAGNVATDEGKMLQLKYITFFNIRIAKEKKDIAKKIVPFIQSSQSVYNTLIIGAPQTGKTTILRDIARLISNGVHAKAGLKVGIIDERSEIAACYRGIPQHDIGIRTDVMDACPKINGLMMMIRSMSPEVLIVDEIGKKEDVQALSEAITAGVSIICTIHGSSLEEVKQRPAMERLLSANLFKRFIVMKRDQAGQFRASILDNSGGLLYEEGVLT